MTPLAPGAAPDVALVDGPFNELSPAEAELLAWLAEEASEVVHAAMKILRHGLDRSHPTETGDNRDALERELGNLTIAVRAAIASGMLSRESIGEHAERKRQSVHLWLHHVRVQAANEGADRVEQLGPGERAP